MLHYSFSGTAVLLGLVALCLALIVGTRWYRHRRTAATLKPAPDVLRSTATVSQLSFCAAILATFLTINWTQYREDTVYAPVTVGPDLFTKVMPITYDRPKPPPLPPPPKIELTPDPEVEAVEQVDQAVTEDTPIDPYVPPTPKARRTVPEPPPIPPAPEIVDPGPVLFAERMPVFGEECKQLSGEERKACSDRALLTFVQGGAGYPTLARENGIEGVVVVSFVVEKDGTVSSVRALREQPGGLTEAALRAVARINREGLTFSPGIQGGLPVRVAFNLPVKFILEK